MNTHRRLALVLPITFALFATGCAGAADEESSDSETTDEAALRAGIKTFSL